MQAELLLEPADEEAGRARLDDEGTDLGRAVIALAGPGGDDVGARLAGVGDEALVAIDDPRTAAMAVLGPARGGARAARI